MSEIMVKSQYTQEKTDIIKTVQERHKTNKIMKTKLNVYITRLREKVIKVEDDLRDLIYE